eukprot:CAMPEP_0115836930 /NCGR_PEP_ID=MMETSP0287-20121206/4960_1 /TAXON_ID=412157 /ORGANISM="Chrysochromulina rotalis, Strain UIO044" /LENGTH=104 /DNA_ID=CAMNT_0003290427 /DNA_START=327 /DNA_END=638 /DNA_ORIENTATION=+
MGDVLAAHAAEGFDHRWLHLALATGARPRGAACGGELQHALLSGWSGPSCVQRPLSRSASSVSTITVTATTIPVASSGAIARVPSLWVATTHALRRVAARVAAA